MKTIKLFLPGLALVAAIAWSSCANKNNEPDGMKPETMNEAEKHNEAKFDNKAENDAQFLAEAADINLTEMKLSQLAEKNAILESTKELANMMQNAHKKSYDELVSLASKKTISIPSTMSEASQKDYNDLMEKRGKDFDKKYCDMMVSGHKNAIDKFENASKDAVDKDIQTWATGMLTPLRNHLDHAMTCQENADKLK